MMLLNDPEEQDLIHQSRRENHNIQRYQFKSIDKNAPIMDYDTPVSDADGGFQQETNNMFSNSFNEQNVNSSLEKELIEKLLQKTDELSSSLAKMQIQVEKQQLDLEDRLALTKSDSYKDGLRDGEQKAKNEMLEEIQKEKQSLVNAIIALDKSLKNSEEKLAEFEKELAQIAIDMAREVIVKEIEDNAQQVALSLAKALIGSIKDVTQMQLRVNTLDYPFLRENLELKNIQLEADDNISRGGVVISSNSGNIDGNIMSRFKILKQSVLENT